MSGPEVSSRFAISSFDNENGLQSRSDEGEGVILVTWLGFQQQSHNNHLDISIKGEILNKYYVLSLLKESYQHVRMGSDHWVATRNV